MLERIFAHYKTTLAGIGLAALGVILNGRTPHSLIAAIGVAVLGSLSKD